ncbi:LysR family transcriptional regulator [Caldinitratiruptor microaerophilus]|uniref:LysR family transcriptional regulator n=1 Tax=Caldinitratiruptor microaerophilus TaxID=671077 RepID=A0AA35G8U8_9FIRM|nr:LysR family transcriptional regulator [Caldinitratiruptor microaerophilus]BDG59614.1 LysR family transcriptional regulator [Caldinitratiruptor microaerophilus]
MRLEQLEAFCAAVRTGSISGGARSLGLTQAAASQRIKALEEDLGVQLLARGPGGVVPTPAGDEILRVALRAIALLRQVERPHPAQPVTVRVGATPVLAADAVPQALLALRTVAPEVVTSLQIGVLDELLRDLEDGTLHIVYAEGPLDRPGLRVTTIGRDTLRLVGSAADVWNVRPALSPEEWLEQPHVLFPTGCGLRRALHAAMVSAGLPPEHLQVRAEFSSLEAIQTLVETGVGLTWLPRRAVRRGLQAGTLQLLDVRGFRVEFPYLALSRSARPLPPAAVRLTSLVADLLDHRRAARRRRQLV